MDGLLSVFRNGFDPKSQAPVWLIFFLFFPFFVLLDLVQESYVDRDRLIAVSIGESDIRETMLKHREFLAEKNPEMHFEVSQLQH